MGFSVRKEIPMSEAILKETTKCKKNFSCLSLQASSVCSVQHTIGSRILVTLCGAGPLCPYCVATDYMEGFCKCPTRRELHRRYGI
jgi:hypothetical protein